MPIYTLYNKKLDRKLFHPRVGLWHTNSLQEAEELLAACHQYLHNTGMPELIEDFSVVEIDKQGDLIEKPA